MNTNRPWEIYTLSDPMSGAVRYVGITFRPRQRLNEHVSKASKGGRTHRDCWIRSLLAVDTRPVYAAIERGSGDGWQDAERRQIAHHRAMCDLVNHTDGGDGTPGHVPTAEQRAKWSIARKGVPYAPGRVSAMMGRHHTAEARAKISDAGTGRRHTAQSKAKLSEARSGKSLSVEHRAKLSKAHAGKVLAAEHKAKIAATTANRKPVLCVTTGATFASITEAARSLGVTESSVYQAIRKGCRCKGNLLRLM